MSTFRDELKAQAVIAARRPAPGRRSVFPRALPFDTPVSRLWAGTKLLALLVLTSLMLWIPRWPTIALVGFAFLLAMRVARVPRSAVPRIPFLLWWMALWGGMASLVFGDLEPFVRTTVLGVVVALGALLLLWTTRPEHLAPTAVALLRPLRLVRAPVEEWAASMALAIRGLRVVGGELQAIRDASRLRGGWQRRLDGPRTTRRVYAAMGSELVDVVTAALSAADRRATATGRAMTLRGGVPAVPRERVRLGIGDVLTALVVTAVVAVSLYLRHR